MPTSFDISPPFRSNTDISIYSCTEIQLHIWRHAVPDPYSISSAIVMIVNPDVDLSRPRAFLPYAKKLLHTEYSTGAGETEICLEEINKRQPIFNVMQSCHNARTAILETYRLDIDSIIPSERIPLCKDPEDMIYFHHFPNDDEYGLSGRTMIQYLTRESFTFLGCFETLRHIAFRFSYDALGALKMSSDYDDDDENDSDDGSPGFREVREAFHMHENFPALESVSLFVDKFHLFNTWVKGKLVLYPVEDDARLPPVGLTADQVESKLERKLSRRDWPKGSPVVDVYVAARRMHKKKRV